MTLEELYASIGGNYDEVMKRLRMEKLVAKFIAKFPDDKSCPSLFEAWEAGDETAAFEAAHATKGVCANLSLTNLADIAHEITEALRPGNDAIRAQTDIDARMADLREAYTVAIDGINAYLAS